MKRPADLTAEALGCPSLTYACDVCFCPSQREPCAAQVAIVKRALAIGAQPYDRDDPCAGLPMSLRDLAMWAFDVAVHLGAGVGRITVGAAKQGARDAGYRIYRGRVHATFDHEYWKRVPHWRDRGVALHA